MSIIFFLILLIIGLIALMRFLQNKAATSEMLSEQIEIYSQMTVQEILTTLRSVKCQMERLQEDQLEMGNSKQNPDIAVLMSGRVTFSEAFKRAGTGRCKWGVQAVVYDLGNKRHIKLIAIGEKSALRQSFHVAYVDSAASAEDYYHIKQSIDYRDRIAQLFS